MVGPRAPVVSVEEESINQDNISTRVILGLFEGTGVLYPSPSDPTSSQVKGDTDGGWQGASVVLDVILSRRLFGDRGCSGSDSPAEWGLRSRVRKPTRVGTGGTSVPPEVLRQNSGRRGPRRG